MNININFFGLLFLFVNRIVKKENLGYDMRNITYILDIKNMDKIYNKQKLYKILINKNNSINTKIDYINQHDIFDNYKLSNITKGGLMKDWDFLL
jgi:hypothetical protein